MRLVEEGAVELDALRVALEREPDELGAGLLVAEDGLYDVRVVTVPQAVDARVLPRDRRLSLISWSWALLARWSA